jgi:hypothetical protein
MPAPDRDQAFAQESLRWLFETFDLAGVQMEAGDTGVCRCPQCEARREHPVSTFSWDDMALMYPLATEAICSVRQDAFIIAETYSHPQPYGGEEPGFGGGIPEWAPACLARFPADIVAQSATAGAPHGAPSGLRPVPLFVPRRHLHAGAPHVWHRFCLRLRD